MEIKGIKYTGPILDNSGYAQASRGNIMALHKLGIPLTLNPISFEQIRPDLGETGKVIDSLIDKKIDYNINIMHCTPEFYENHKEEGKLNIGYTIWETTKLHPDWPDYINNNVDALMVGCDWNVGVFKDSGVTVPIFSVPHGIGLDEFINVRPFDVSGVDKDAFVFYSIFQWCYDEQTRVLTKEGFKYFKDLQYSDEIATLNKETEELEYYKPDKIVSFYRKDKMFQLSGHQFDICVTPDHKMVVKDNTVEEVGAWQLKPFNELFSDKRKSEGKIISSKYKTKKNCIWSGEEVESFNIPVPEGYTYKNSKASSVVRMDDFLTFFGWYLSEGSIEISKNYYRIAITQLKNKENIKEIMKSVFSMGFSPFIHNDKDILFNSRDLCLYLQQFGKCHEKFVPIFVKNLSTRQIKILLTSLFKGDGSLYGNGDWVKYVTTSKKLAEDVQECLLKVGMSGAISVSDPKLKKPGRIDGRLIKGKKLQYTVSVNRKHNEPVMCHAKFKEIDYDGMIYCATVKNHTMLVERNGKILFSGNTERKHPLAMIKAYWHAFQNNENVALVLKTYRSDYSEPEKEAIRTTLKRLKMVTPMDGYPPIYLISNMLTNDEILGLHKRCNCYVSLDRGEGFGLSPFTAGAAGNPIIVTGFGGSTEYAKEDNSYLVNYTLTPVHGMPWCLTENNYIKTDKGFISVEDLLEKDLVINKNFECKPISKLAKRVLLPSERILSLNIKSCPINSEVTNLHKLYTVKDNKPVKVRAEEINVGDYIYTPKPVLSNKDLEVDLNKYTIDNNWVIIDDRIVYGRDINTSTGTYIKPTINPDLFYLIGLYLAEGCVYSSNDCVSFSFNASEKDSLVFKCKSKIKSVFGLTEHHIYEREYKDRSGIEIVVNNVLVGRFFKDTFGTGAAGKFVNHKWLLPKSDSFRSALLKGYWDGDGHISYRHSKINPECVATTKSFDLCMCIRDVLLSFNIVPSITMNTRSDGRVSFITSVSSDVMDNILGIEGTNRKPNNFYNYEIEGGFALRVTSVTEVENYNGIIYSVAVEPGIGEEVSGSYILNGVASSNSPWYRADQLWAEPDVKHGADLMYHVFENRDEAKARGKKLQSYIYDSFAWEVIGQKIIDGIRSL